MDIGTPKRRLSAFLSLVIPKSAKDQSHHASSRVNIDEKAPKKASRLRRLSQGIRRWRNSRKKTTSAQKSQHCPKASIDSSSSGGTPSINCQGVVTQNSHIQEEVVIPSKEEQPVIVEDITPEAGDAQKGSIAASSSKSSFAVVESTPSFTADRVEETIETILDTSDPFSTPQSVYIRKRKEAKQFANDIVSDTSSTTSSNRWIYWTDASLRAATNNQLRGGISVAQQRDGNWKVEFAHVVGLNSTAHLEALAILMALKTAVQDCRGKESILIFSDGASSLTWLDKVLSLFLAMDEANRELQTSKCYARAVISFSQAFGFSKLDKYPGTELQGVICLQILEAYSKLRQLGTLVEFHWVPGHSNVIGNMIAHTWAFNACLWFADVSVCVNKEEAKVMPLEPVDLSHQRPTASSISNMLESIEDLQYILKVESNESTVRPPPKKTYPRLKAVERAPKQASDQYGKSLTIVNLGIEEDAGRGALAKKADGKALRKSRVRCSACHRRGHMRDQCRDLDTCGWCRKGEHSEETCQNKLSCTICGNTGHSHKTCQETSMAQPDAVAAHSGPGTIATPSIVIPKAGLAVSILHPTLMGHSCNGARSQYMLGQVGLGPHLASKITFRSSVALDNGSEVRIHNRRLW